MRVFSNIRNYACIQVFTSFLGYNPMPLIPMQYIKYDKKPTNTAYTTLFYALGLSPLFAQQQNTKKKTKIYRNELELPFSSNKYMLYGKYNKSIVQICFLFFFFLLYNM